jgi:hypothetical protein
VAGGKVVVICLQKLVHEPWHEQPPARITRPHTSRAFDGLSSSLVPLFSSSHPEPYSMANDDKYKITCLIEGDKKAIPDSQS